MYRRCGKKIDTQNWCNLNRRFSSLKVKYFFGRRCSLVQIICESKLRLSACITWMCSTSAKIQSTSDSQFLYSSFPGDVKEWFFFQHYVVFVILFEGLSPASLLHQLKSSECYHSSECVMDFCLLEMHKMLYFLNFCKVSSKYLLLSDRWGWPFGISA